MNPGTGPAPAPGRAQPAPGVFPVSTKKSPLIVASLGTYSGPAGSTLTRLLEGAQLWTQFINARGGLNGHAVKLLVYDDGGDPSRHRAQVQDAIEQQHAVALLMYSAALTYQGSADYITAKRIPVIGTEGAPNLFYQNPMYFPQMSAGDPLLFSFIAATAQQVVPAGLTKLATVVCTEAQVCRDADRVFSGSAKELGLQLVSAAKSSLAQPDFTAECLSARNAGAQTMLVVMDTNSLSRLASSCARQGYRPQFATAASIIVDRFKDDPNLDHLIASTGTFPYFQTNTPATAEFYRAVDTFGKSLTLGVGTSQGWTAGKVLERAGTALAEPPTSESILQGLWTIKNDDLGGLTLPLTYVEQQPTKPQSCWFALRIQDHRWTNPDGYVRHCR